MLRVWHPELKPVEVLFDPADPSKRDWLEQVDAIKYIFSALDEPEIVERDLRALKPSLFEVSLPIFIPEVQTEDPQAKPKPVASQSFSDFSAAEG